MLLCNSSTSDFSISSLFEDCSYCLRPSSNVYLICGGWSLELGKGLKFQMAILPRASGSTHHSLFKFIPRAGRNAPITKPSGKANPTVSKAGIEKQNSCDQQLQPSTKILPATLVFREIIRETLLTRVFMANKGGKDIAVKVFKGPDLKQSADTWRDELNILQRLNHVSKSEFKDSPCTKINRHPL